MAVTLTYDTTNARVHISVTGLGNTATAVVERSTNQITWTTVRGAAAVAVTSGAASLYDYEFSPGVTNYYRATPLTNGPVQFVAVGTASTGSSGSRTPGAPAGIQAGDLLVLLASTRAGTVNVPSGWTDVGAASSGGGAMGMSYKVYVSGAMPTVTFTGGSANQDTLAQIVAFRGQDAVVADSENTGTSGQNIAYPALSAPDDVTDPVLNLLAGWKIDDWTSVATVAGYTEISEVTSTAGNDAGQVWDYKLAGEAADIPAGSFTVTGGTSTNAGGMSTIFGQQLAVAQSSSILPALTDVWLKSVTRPFLNRVVQVVSPSQVTLTRPGRGQTATVIGRTYPVASTDVRGGVSWTLMLRTDTADDGQTMEYIVAAGDVMLLQVPHGCRTARGGYYLVGDVGEVFHPLRVDRRTWSLPLTEVAAPGPYVAANESTWASVLAAYADWTAVLADNPTWADLKARRGDPAEVVVP